MTQTEAVAAGLNCDVMIAWGVDDRGCRQTLYHIELPGADATLCGRRSAGWKFELLTLRTVGARLTCVCSECRRRWDEVDLREGQPWA